MSQEVRPRAVLQSRMSESSNQRRANDLIEELSVLKSDTEFGKLKKFFKGNDGRTQAFGVKFGDVFATAKRYTDLSIDEISILLDSDYYEIRMAAVSVMGFKTRLKRTSADERRALYELYLNRHDRINNWDLVDRASYDVIGAYLLDKPRDVLYTLARSANIWERRTAIVSTYAFIKTGDVDDTFRIAEILINDPEELINKAVGSWIREAGKRDEARLRAFLDRHAATMPRVTLRYAVEKLPEAERKRYMAAARD